jgi:hypothetical protein
MHYCMLFRRFLFGLVDIMGPIYIFFCLCSSQDELLRSASYQTLYTVVTQMEGTLNDKVYSTHPDVCTAVPK